MPKEETLELKPIPIKQPKLIKTQGSQRGDNVHCSLQDKHGNLWFGTTGEGVYKFNGNSFTQYTVSDGLIRNSVLSLLEDTSGSLWVGTRNTGLLKFDGAVFTSFINTRAANKSPFLLLTIK